MRMSELLPYLWMAWGAVTVALTILVVYGNTLSMKEDDEIYLNSAENVMMGSEQKALVTEMHELLHIILPLAVCSAVLFATCVGVWAWIGLSR